MEEGKMPPRFGWKNWGLERRSRSLSYYLYSICERKGWAQEALAYNTLVTSWPACAALL